jgi:hypothetical protein
MVFMTAGMLDHRNIGSNISLVTEEGNVSGSLALITQTGHETEIVLAHDEEAIVVTPATPVDISLPPVAAYTLGMKNAIEELLALVKEQGKTLRVVA